LSGKRVFFHKIQSHCAAAFLARDSQNWSTRPTPTAAIGYAAKGTPASLRLLRARSRSLSNTRCGNSLPVRVPRCPPVLVASDVRHQSGGRLTPRAWFPARRVHTRYPSEPRTLLAALSAVSGYKKKNASPNPWTLGPLDLGPLDLWTFGRLDLWNLDPWTLGP
jgi:hypothetical protein